MKVALNASFDMATEVGSDAVSLATNLARLGVTVLPMPDQVTPPLPREFTRLLETPLEPRPDVMIRLAPASRSGERVPVDGVKQVLYTSAERGYDGLDAWDAVVVPTPAARDALAASYSGPTAVVPTGLDVEFWAPDGPRRDTDEFRFLVLGPPKYVTEAWSQFTETHGEGVATLRVVEPGRITNADLLSAYRDADVLILTGPRDARRGPEMLACGGAVIALSLPETDGWLRDEVGYVLTRRGPKTLARLLGEIVADRPGLTRRQRTSVGYVNSSMNWRKTADDLMRSISRLVL